MAKTTHAFPLSIYQEYVGLDASYRDRLTQLILAQRKADAAPAPGEGWSGEARGLNGLHRNPEFDPLFDRLAAVLRVYLKEMGINGDHFTVYLTKSWGEVCLMGERLGKRSHAEAHIGLLYCLSKPHQSGAIHLFQADLQNEFVPSLFNQRMVKAGVVEKILPVNTSAVALQTVEGDVAIFPAKFEQATAANGREETSVTVAALVTLTLINSAKLEWGTPDPRNWREF